MGVNQGKSESGGCNGCKNLGDREHGSIIPSTSKIELLVIKKNTYKKTKTNVLARIMKIANNTKYEFQSTAWQTLFIKQTTLKS